MQWATLQYRKQKSIPKELCSKVNPHEDNQEFLAKKLLGKKLLQLKQIFDISFWDRKL
jgi:hypothetical protein